LSSSWNGTYSGIAGRVSSLVRRHHGDIRVQSQPGDTRFQVWLPIDQPSKSSVGAVGTQL
jgi:nitrogen-specific signal transduction histidine kinase